MPLIRLDKFLTDMGVDSRSNVKKLIKQGKVSHNGTVVKDNGLKISTQDEVCVAGRKISYKAYTYIMLNKPQGVISALKDKKEKTVTDLLTPPYSNMGLFPVGRLDKDTTGLLILTNDGAFAHNSLSPKKHVSKTYYVEAEGSFTADICQSFARGITLEDGYLCKPATFSITCLEPHIIKGQLTITEGKFHQIKRMFAALGGRVCHLQRISFGAIALDSSLPLGGFRPLNQKETEYIAQVKQEI